MKTETPPTPTPTIAELWGRLEDDLETASVFSEDVKERLGYNESIKYLRQQLVERCKIFRGHFDKLENRIRFGITVFQTETVSMTTPEGHGMPLNANDLMELSAICAFWAWEIEQREKEASGD